MTASSSASESSAAPRTSCRTPSSVRIGSTFDRHSLTVRPDYTIEVRQSILDEEDGPMLLHGLKGMHDRPIYLPREVSISPPGISWKSDMPHSSDPQADHVLLH